MRTHEHIAIHVERPILVARIALAAAILSIGAGWACVMLPFFLMGMDTDGTFFETLATAMLGVSLISVFTSFVSALIATAKCTKKPWYTLVLSSLCTLIGVYFIYLCL